MPDDEIILMDADDFEGELHFAKHISPPFESAHNASLSIEVTNGEAIKWRGLRYTTEELQLAMIWFALTQLTGPASVSEHAKALRNELFPELEGT